MAQNCILSLAIMPSFFILLEILLSSKLTEDIGKMSRAYSIHEAHSSSYCIFW